MISVYVHGVTGLVDVDLATFSNRIALPRFPGGDAAQFWWIAGLMTAIAAAMLAVFRRNHWI